MIRATAADMDIIVTKWIGLSAAVLAVRERREELTARFGNRFLADLASLEQKLDTSRERALLDCSGAQAAEIGEGGIFAALWRMAEAADTGLAADLRKIPVRLEIIEICGCFDLNPYMLESYGSFLIMAEDGTDLMDRLEREGIPAAWIGRTRPGNDRILKIDDRVMYLTKPQPDEIRKIRTAPRSIPENRENNRMNQQKFEK